MNRRDFLKSALTVAALAPVTRLAAKAGPDGNKTSDVIQGAQVTRKQYKDTIDKLLAMLPPGKKAAVVEESEDIIRKIAYGDQPFLIRQDLLKKLKQKI